MYGLSRSRIIHIGLKVAQVMEFNYNPDNPWDHMHGLDLSEEISQLATSCKFGEDLPAYVEQQQQQPPPPQQQEVVVQHVPLQQVLPSQQQPMVQVQGHTQQVFFTAPCEASNDPIINETIFTGLKQENQDVSPVENPRQGGQNTAEFAAIMNSSAATGQSAFTPGQAQTLVMPGGKHVMLLPNQAMGPNQYFLAAPTNIGTQVIHQQQQHQQQQQQQQPQPTSGSIDLPAHNDWEGEYDFNVKIEEKERTVKSPMWMMSHIMQKLYTNINKPVPFEVRMHRRPPGVNFNVRATLIFSEQQYMRMNVIRCPNHAAPSDPSNHDFPYPEHVVRCDHPGAKYESHPSGRLSVIVPLDNLQDGMEFTPILLRFMCLGSCVGGINRKFISLILGLEDMSGRTVGRRVIHVRVCACPTRDIKTDELQYQNKGIKRKGTTGLVEKKVLTKKTKTKEPKLEPADDDDDDQIYYLPVRGRKLYNYLQDMMVVFSRHFPDQARHSSVEAPGDENAQQKPNRLLD